MSLFSFFRKNKQDAVDEGGAYYSRAEEESQPSRRRKAAAGSRRADGTDPVLPEKKRARRRLIGAIALVLAAVIGLPMILDSEPKPLAQDIAIHIPSRDSVPPPAANPAPAAALVPGDSGNTSVIDSLDPSEEIVTAGVPATLPARTDPVAGASATAPPVGPAKPAPSPVGPAKATTPAPAVVTPAARTDDGERALALLEGRSDQRPNERKTEQFVVQVAALASQEKVNELQGKLKTAGIKSYTQKVATESGERTRVRVGPFASREEAEKMRARIVKLGLNGTLVPA